MPNVALSYRGRKTLSVLLQQKQNCTACPPWLVPTNRSPVQKKLHSLADSSNILQLHVGAWSLGVCFIL